MITTQQTSREKNFVIRKFKTYYHNGMIPLIHACSKSNTQALGKFLLFLRKRDFGSEL